MIYKSSITFFLVIAALFATAVSSMPQIIIDNNDTAVTVFGAWVPKPSDKSYGPQYLHDNNAGKGVRYVKFTPNISTAGTYEVYMYWPSWNTFAINTPVVVRDQNSSIIYTVNQQTKGSTWVLLGVHNFATGTGNSVTIITNGTSEYVIVDAVGFSAVSLPTPTSTHPVISGISAVSVRKFDAIINWTTDKVTNSQVEFLGPCPSTGCISQLTPLSTSHSINIFNLATGTTYPYRVIARDVEGNLATSPAHSFTTQSTPIGPILGAVTDDSIKILSRTIKPSAVKVMYKKSSDASFISSNTINVVADNDYTAAIILSGLLPNTQYDYQLLIDGTVNATSSFMTLPMVDQPSRFSFSVGADLLHSMQPFTIMDSVDAKNPLFNIILGDIMYADAAPGATNLDEFREKYKENFADKPLASFLSKRPTIYIWDDHEIQNNWDMGTILIYPTARRAYDEYITALNPSPRVQGNLYYNYKAGQVDFYVFDTRTFRVRSAQPGVIKTMLGEAQKADFKNWLLSSSAKFKIVISSVPFTDFGTTGGDSWFGYQAERTELIDFIRNNNIKGVIFISGDQHWSMVARLNTLGPTYNLYEFMPTPLAASKRTATSSTDPQILFKQDKAYNYGLFTVDTTVSPAMLTYINYDQNNNPLYELTIDETNINPSSVLDITKPNISLTQPLSGARLSGTINISVNASDDIAIAGVQFKVNGVNIAPEDITAPYTINWNSTIVENGTYTISAVARDTSGNIATDSVNISVNNVPIQITPLDGDLNLDRVVNMQDIFLIVNDFGKTSGFDPFVDLAPSGSIDIFDVMVVVKNWGNT